VFKAATDKHYYQKEAIGCDGNIEPILNPKPGKGLFIA
jgi:hypothetical protein